MMKSPLPLINSGEQALLASAAVGEATAKFWQQFWWCMVDFRISREDVYQQAWLEYLELKREGSTSPGAYVLRRLISWMQKQTGFRRVSRVRAAVEHWPTMDDLYAPKVDMDRPLLVERVKDCAKDLEPRIRYTLERHLEGYTMKEIGQELHVTEARICQFYGKVVKQAKLALAVSLLVLCMPLVGLAQSPTMAELPDGCQSVEWDANTEPDLDGYKLFIEQDGTPLPPVIAEKTQVRFFCSSLPFVPGATYRVSLSAFDRAGNESAPSAPVGFHWPEKPDEEPPDTPTRVCVKGTVDGEPKDLCFTVD